MASSTEIQNRTFDEANNAIRVTNAGSGASSSQLQGTAADNAAAVGNPVRVGGKYNATLQTYGDGDIADAQADVNGRHIVTMGTLLAGEDLTNNTTAVSIKPVAGSAYSSTVIRGFTATTYQNAKATPGALNAIAVTNTNAAVRYLQIFNTTGAPSGGTGLFLSLPIPAGTATVPGTVLLGKDMLENTFLSTAVTVAVSTTETTFTAATAGDHTLHTWSY